MAIEMLAWKKTRIRSRPVRGMIRLQYLFWVMSRLPVNYMSAGHTRGCRLPMPIGIIAVVYNFVGRQTTIFLYISLFVLLSGCGTMSNSRRWGEDVTLRPGWKKIGESAYNALTSLLVIIPAAAALLLQIGGADERLSDWASDHTPIAVSNRRAERLSKDLRSGSSHASYLSILATPSGDDPIRWGLRSSKGLPYRAGPPS